MLEESYGMIRAGMMSSVTEHERAGMGCFLRLISLET